MRCVSFIKAAFLLPIIANLLEFHADELAERPSPPAPLCLILSPTRELALQTTQVATKFAFETAVKSGTFAVDNEQRHRLFYSVTRLCCRWSRRSFCGLSASPGLSHLVSHYWPSDGHGAEWPSESHRILCAPSIGNSLVDIFEKSEILRFGRSGSVGQSVRPNRDGG